MAKDITLDGADAMVVRVRHITIDLDAKRIGLTVERVNKATFEVESHHEQAVGAAFEAFAAAVIPASAANMYEAVQGAAWEYLEGLGAERITGRPGASFRQ